MPTPIYRPGMPKTTSQSSSYRLFVIYFISVALIWLVGVLLLGSLNGSPTRARFADTLLRSNRAVVDTSAAAAASAVATTVHNRMPATDAALTNPCTNVVDNEAIVSHTDAATGNRVYFHVLPPWLSCILNSSLLSSPPSIASLPHPLDFPIDDSPQLTTCQSDDFGAGLLRRWQSAHSSLSESGGGSSGNSSSAMIEHKIRQARHSGDDMYVEMQHVTLDPADGRLHLRCSPNAQYTQAANSYSRDQKGLQDVVQLITFDDKAVASSTAAKDGPVYTLFVRRDCDGAGNLYHCSADLINAFMLLHSISLSHSTTTASPSSSLPLLPAPTNANTIILFTDENPSLTKFSLLWQALSPASTPYTAYRKSLSSSTTPLSLPRVYGALQSGANMIWKDFWFNDPCAAVSPILDAFSRFATAIYLPHPLPLWLAPPVVAASAAQQSQSLLYAAGGRGAIRVLIASRRNAQYRRASNEEELARYLGGVLPVGSSIVLVDLGSLSFEQQVAAVNSIDLLVGMHGAALNLLLFVLPERRRVELKQKRLHLMELFTNEKDRPKTYANMAVRLGIGYGAWVGTRELKEIDLDVPAIGQVIKDMYHLK